MNRFITVFVGVVGFTASVLSIIGWIEAHKTSKTIKQKLKEFGI